MHTKKFKIKLDNSFILTQSRRCRVHRAKSFHQDDLEHLLGFVYAKLFLLYCRAPLAPLLYYLIRNTSTCRSTQLVAQRLNIHNFVNFAPIDLKFWHILENIVSIFSRHNIFKTQRNFGTIFLIILCQCMHSFNKIKINAKKSLNTLLPP